MRNHAIGAAFAALLAALLPGVARSDQPVASATPRTGADDAGAGDACRRPADYIVEAANQQLATSLAKQYGELFQAEQAGTRVVFRSRTDDPHQQRELKELAADPRLRIVEEARFEPDAARDGDPLHFHNEKLWSSIHMPPLSLQPRSGIDVAVLDGPVRADHEDLPEVVFIQPRARADDGHCDVADCCPVVAPLLPANWHATRVAGVIGARRGNRKGTAGLAPVRRIVSINTSVSGCTGEVSLAAALHCAIEYRDPEGGRARVANISMGSRQRLATTALTTALQRAANENLLVVASAGNTGTNIDSIYRWPASYNASNVVTVEARRYDGTLSKNTSFGYGTVDLGAPAPMGSEDTTMCAPSTPVVGATSCSGQYGGFEQSSAAAAVVSGAAALILSDRRYASCNATQVRELLRASRQHCHSGYSYREQRDFEVCMLDLDFLSKRPVRTPACPPP